MVRALHEKKKLLVGITLLIVGAAATIFYFLGWTPVVPGQQSLAIDIPLGLAPSLESTSSQEMAAEPVEFSWPSILSIPPAAKTADMPSSTLVLGLPEPAVRPASDSVSWCMFQGEAPSRLQVVLNEIAWMGSARSANDEWIELKNVAGRDVDMTGWRVQDESGSIAVVFGDRSVLPQAGFLLLARRGASTTAVADKEYSGALANSGAQIKLFNADCKVVDSVDASDGWPGGNNVTKQTLEREVGGTGWQTSEYPGGSPRVQNTVLTASTTYVTAEENGAAPSYDDARHDDMYVDDAATTTPNHASTSAPRVMIVSVQITGGPGAAAADYIKMFNASTQPADISGWKLRKRSKTGGESSVKSFAQGARIAPGGYFTWANSENDFAASMNADTSSTQTLASDNSIAIIDAEDATVDALAWGAGHTSPYIEGEAYPENPGPDQVLARKFEGLQPIDTGDNSADFRVI